MVSVSTQAIPGSLRGILTGIESETVFPWSLVDAVFDRLEERNATCIRYCDLQTQSSWCGSRYRYLDEFLRFKYRRVGLMSAVRDLIDIGLHGSSSRTPQVFDAERKKSDAAPTVILQHDADALPERTLEMMRRERQRHLVSSCYFLVRPVDNAEYSIDIATLQRLEEEGFEVGYHQNAYERSGYQLEQALSLVESDLMWMRRHFNIRSFVPHGGTPSSDGLNNASLPHAGALRPLMWAYNGDCVLKDFMWSDGGIKKNTPMDPREFVKALAPGARAVMLLHPQYYGETLRHGWERLPIARQRWWRDLWNL